MSGITVERIGRRSYLRGNTYPIKDALREAGAHWDRDERAWWIGSKDKAAALAERFSGAGEEAGSHGARDAAPGLEATVAGRAKYKGRTYYVAGRVDRGRTHYDDGVDAITSRDGSRVLLYSRDGKLSFWARLWRDDRAIIRVGEPTARAPHDQAEVIKTYSRPQTIARLREYAEQAEANKREHGHASCAECGRGGALVDAPDSSGIVAGVCSRCASLSRYERSYA